MASMANMCLRNMQAFPQLLFRTNTCPGANVLFHKSCFHHSSFSRVPNLGVLCRIVKNKRLYTTPPPLCLRQVTRQLSTSHVRHDRSVYTVVCPSRWYSTQKANETSTVTSDLLKAKLAEHSQNTEQESTTEGTEKEKSKTKSKWKDGKTNENSWFHAKHAWKLGVISLGAMSLLMCGNLILMWGTPLRDNEGNEMEDEFSSLPSWQAYPKRAMKEAHFFKTMIEEPSYKKLLPDPLKEPWYQPPYTLVIELTGVLVHPDWTLGTGWRFKKRPAVTYFLQQVASPLFEVVVFTKEQGFTAFPIIDGLDPNGHVTYRLFRDATRYMDGAHVKDLENLNRDLSKVILVDCDPKAIKKQPRNAMLLKTWKGADDDRTLVDLAAFLKTIAMSSVEDVRPVLEHYSQFDDPLEAFKENQRRLGEQEKSQRASEQPEKTGLLGFGRSFSIRK